MTSNCFYGKETEEYEEMSNAEKEAAVSDVLDVREIEDKELQDKLQRAIRIAENVWISESYCRRDRLGSEKDNIARLAAQVFAKMK